MVVTQKEISAAIDKLNLSGTMICLHSSLKSFGHLEGGADTIIDAFVEKKCTLFVPTFFYNAKVCPQVEERYPQNGCDYTSLPLLTDPDVKVYDPAQKLIAAEMGTLPKRILNTPGSIRGNHPINSFSALGPYAEELITCQAPLAVYAPFEKLYEKDSAYILLMGTDLTSATPIHFAEKLAGRRLFREYAKVADNKAVEAEVGSCSEGFNNLEPFISDITTAYTVGESLWRVFSFKAFIDRVTDVIKNNPMITHCENPDCIRCNDAIKGGPVF